MRTSMRAVVVASLLLVAGCTGDGDAPAGNGIAELSAATVMERSLAAVKAAPYFRIEIYDLDEGKRKSLTTIDVMRTDLHATVLRDGASAEVLKAGANHYIRADQKFWVTMLENPKQAKAYAAAAGNRWIKADPGDDLLHKVALDGVFGFAEGEALSFFLPRQAKLGQRTEIGGVPAISVIDGADNKTEFLVSATGEPYPIRWDVDFGGTVADFTGFGTTPPTVEEPAPADTLEMSAILRSGVSAS